MKINLCVFDLDGTLYPKESQITYEIRNQVISEIGRINHISYDDAKELYKQLPKKEPNPYHGLKSLNFSAEAYQAIFNSIPICKYISPDYILSNLLEQISKKADIIIVSFAPEQYVNNMLENLGVRKSIKQILSVNKNTNYSKEPLFRELLHSGNYKFFYSIGDDWNNDIIPSMEMGYISYHVDFLTKNNNIYSVLQKLNSKLSWHVPRIMRVENISFCNEKCIICPYEYVKRKKGVMSDQLFRQIIIEHSTIVDNPKLIFPASIGEPLLDKFFFDKLAFAKKYYSSIATFTNASLLTEDLFEKYVYCGGTELMLTLHGFSEKMHSNITKTTLYPLVRSNIESIVKKNAELGYPVTVFLDVYADDSTECQEFISEMKTLNVKAKQIPLKETHNWGGQVKCYSKKGSRKHCNRIYEQFGVQFDGKVVPCCIDTEGEYVLGKIPEMSLQEIFSAPPYERLVSQERNGLIHELKLCSDCNI